MNEIEFQKYINTEIKKRRLRAPFMNAFRLLRLGVYQFSKDHRDIKKLRNRYLGERCFIVGNGPSLTINDLERLKTEHCFAFNRIYELYDKTSWRPEFYMVLDNDVMKNVAQNIHKISAKYKILNIMGKTLGIKKDANTFFFCSYGLYRAKEYNFVKKSISKDISKYISLNFSVTAAAIETAIYMGFNEIYIIGLDNNFSRWIDKNGKIHLSNIEDYKLIKPHDFNYFCYQDAVNSCFDCYRRYCDKKGIRIFNATRGGKLESFERVDFDILMEEKNE